MPRTALRILLLCPIVFTFAVTQVSAVAVRAEAQITPGEMREAGLVVGDIVVPDFTGGILLYNGQGTFIEKLLTVPDSTSGVVVSCCLTFGPDENLYVSSPTASSVVRLNGVTGEFIDTFIQPGSGGLVIPLILLFQGDYLYVGDTGAGAIRRYNAHTGAFVDNFIPDVTHVAFDLQCFAFGPDNNLYVALEASKKIMRYNGKTGAFVDEFVPSTAGLSPSGLTFGPDGLLYAGSPATGEVRRYNLSTGAREVFIPGGGTLSVPVGIAFGPDGNFYATSVGFSAILAYDGETGAFLGPLVPSGLGGIGGPRTLAWKAKTTVCHVPPGRNSKSKSLTIGYLSARDHLRHGDTLGPCQ